MIRFGLLFFLLCACNPSPKGDAAADAAVSLAKKSMQAMGGEEVFGAKRFLRFDFVVMRNDTQTSHHRHLWDRQRGRYRVEGKQRDGRSYAVLFTDLGRNEGTAYREGVPLHGDEADKMLDYGYARFINDTYWLLMPWKMLDPGVKLSYEGVDSTNGDFIVHLQFDRVGITPGDQYWAYLDEKTGLLSRWRYTLQDGEKGDYDWIQWVEKDGLRLSEVKTSRLRNHSIRTTALGFPSNVDDRLFSDAMLSLP